MQPTFESNQARLASFGHAIDAIKKDVESRIGEGDLRHVKRLRLFSRAMEIVGRTCIHISFEPILFGIGVVALFLHKQVEATEIGHTALHGAYDRFGENSGFHSSKFWWRVPIDEESWRQGHNVKHHGHTNVAGKDPDIHFGPVRLTTHTPWRPAHRFQLPLVLFHIFPNFVMLMNLHFTGLNDVWFGNGRGGMDVLSDRSKASIRGAYWKTIRKYVPYYAYEYVLFPLLCGPFFWKVLLGNWLSETMRDVYCAATIFCGHIGAHIKAYPETERTTSRGAWYARQVESTNDFEVSWPVSVLCGGLDRQIEHHLFPKFPPERLREAAPLVQKACEEHGVRYHSGPWGTVLGKALSWIAALSRPSPTTTVIEGAAADGQA
jgi:NADPH-dependent stearoyl-CoA 9-desaturase